MAVPRRIQPWSLWLILAFLLGGVLVSINYLKKNRAEALDPRPPYLGKLERDLAAQNRDGSPVHLAVLSGRIWLASCLYTGSPSKAPAVTHHLRSIWEEFGTNPRLQVVLFSVNPDGDTAEKRNEFVRKHGADDPRWWFLASESQEMSRFAVRYLRMMPTRPAQDPRSLKDWGPLEHDVRVALIDGKANLRGLYQLLQPASEKAQLERLRQDLKYLLEESR